MHESSQSLDLKGFSAGYAERQLIDKVNLRIPAGELTAMIGRNGAGKSTILRAIAGINPHFTGEVEIDGVPINLMHPLQRSMKISFVNTERPRIANLTVRDLVGLGRAPYTNWIGQLSAKDNEIINEALRLTSMESYAERKISTMSDGECQRAMIARALAQDTPVILLDEPTSFLDLPSRHELIGLLRRLAHESGKTILVSTHELGLALQKADNIALLADKKLRLLPTGNPYTRREIEETFGLKVLE